MKRTLRRLFVWVVELGIVFHFATLSGVAYADLVGVSGGLVQTESQAKENTQQARCVALELYFHAGDESSKHLVEGLKTVAAERRGVSLKLVDLDGDSEAADRLEKIVQFFKLRDVKLPLLYGLNQAVDMSRLERGWRAEFEQLLSVQFFVRSGCSRCAAAKQYLPNLRAKYPGLEFQVLDVLHDSSAADRYNKIAARQKIGGISFPGIWLCQQLVVGFDGTAAGESRLSNVLQRWTFPCKIPKLGWLRNQPLRQDWPTEETMDGPTSVLAVMQAARFWLTTTMIASPTGQTVDPARDRELTGSEKEFSQGEQPPLPLEFGTEEFPELPLDDSLHATDSQFESDEIEVPWLGRLSAGRLGMPAFTLMVGLIDGFNPCAMWVLLFLLSILVNLQDRWKILAVAGTFVFISGLAYYAFMAAWLNVLLLVGYLRGVQIALAGLAIVVGTIHVKDFFAFKKGISLSIPDSAKPGIYARVRGIIMAEHLYGAIAGASVLAVLVNFIELLCTAGLPAMYSQILMLQEYPAWKNYSYLGLYIGAYMLDDAVMVAIVIYTLSKRKLQENEGRWLKLVSGLVVLALGFVLLLKPEWLGS